MNAQETTVADWTTLAPQLREARRRHGNPSFTEIARRITALRTARDLPASEAQVARITVYDCFRDQRRRIDFTLVLDIVQALGGDAEEVRTWESLLDAFERRQSAAAVVSVTNRLPDPLAAFIGRAEPLAQITGHPGRHWISGMPGAGKSQLAYEAARQHLQQEAVAQVIVADLRGFSQQGPPAEPESVVNALLRLLGVAHHERSAQLSAKTRTLRDKLLATQSELILDDAFDQQQVRAILPESQGIPVIITSRNSPDDVAASVFDHIPLGVFSGEESLELLRCAVGEQRVAEEQDAAVALVDAAAHLPLAVRLTASRIAARQGWSLTDHLELIAARQETLRLSDEVAQTFSLSYRALPASAQALYRLIAAYPVTRIDHDSVLALAGDSVDQPTEALDALIRQHLLNAPEPDCYSMHSLLRLHAADLSLEIDRPAVRRQAEERLLATLISRNWAAYQVRAQSLGHVPRQPRASIAPVTMTTEQATGFLQNCTELLLHMAHTASESAGVSALAHISETLGPWLLTTNRIEEAEALHSAAIRRAQQTNDVPGIARAQLDMTLVRSWTGRHREAESLLHALAESNLEPQDNVRRLNALGMLRERQGDKSAAEEAYTQSVELARATGNLGGAGFALNNLAGLYDRIGEPELARQNLAESIAISQKLDDEQTAAIGLANLAGLEISAGDYLRAEETARQALAYFNKTEHVAGTVACYVNISRALMGRDEHCDALRWNQNGLQKARDGGLRQFEVTLLRQTARSQQQLGAAQEALTTAQEAVQNADDVGDPAEQGWTRDILAECLQSAGKNAAAVDCWQQALEFLEEAEVSESIEKVRRKLQGHVEKIA